MTLRHDDRCHFHPLLLPSGTEKRAARSGHGSRLAKRFDVRRVVRHERIVSFATERTGGVEVAN